MSIGADSILLHAAGILRTVPDTKQIEGFKSTYSTLAELDAAFLGMAAAKVDPLVGLYQGVFDRVADGAGLDYWVGQANAGASLVQVANSFVHSNEYANTHSGLTDTQVITELYQNFLNRGPDAAGLAYWLGAIHDGLPMANFIASLVSSAEFQKTAAPLIDTFLIDAAYGAPVTGGRLFNVAVSNTAVIDGYIAGATIFVDANGNGVQDAGEFSTISDANGKFDMPETIAAAGTLVSTGGKDLTTGQVNTTVFKAVAGPTTITPLSKWASEISATSAEG